MGGWALLRPDPLGGLQVTALPIPSSWHEEGKGKEGLGRGKGREERKEGCRENEVDWTP